MIGSHDTFTYLRCESPLVELIKKFWRCQVVDIDKQYNAGARFFDVRIMTNTKGGLILGAIYRLFNKKENTTWGCGHGLAEVPQTFNKVEDICRYFSQKFPDAKYRIILEKKNDPNKDLFLQQFKDLMKPMSTGRKFISELYPNCYYIGLKLPWTEIYGNYPENFQFVDTCCRLFNWNPDKSFIYNLKHFKIKWTIKNWAKDNNPKTLTEEQFNSEKICYFMDYVGVYSPIMQKE